MIWTRLIMISNILYKNIPRELVNICMKYRYTKNKLRKYRFLIQ